MAGVSIRPEDVAEALRRRLSRRLGLCALVSPKEVALELVRMGVLPRSAVAGRRAPVAGSVLTAVGRMMPEEVDGWRRVAVERRSGASGCRRVRHLYVRLLPPQVEQ